MQEDENFESEIEQPTEFGEAEAPSPPVELKFAISTGETTLIEHLTIKALLQADDAALVRLLGIVQTIQQKRNLTIDKETLEGIQDWKKAFVKQRRLQGLIKICDTAPAHQLFTPLDYYEKEFDITVRGVFPSPIAVKQAASEAWWKISAEKETGVDLIINFISTVLSGTTAWISIDRVINKYIFAKKREPLPSTMLP